MWRKACPWCGELHSPLSLSRITRQNSHILTCPRCSKAVRYKFKSLRPFLSFIPLIVVVIGSRLQLLQPTSVWVTYGSLALVLTGLALLIRDAMLQKHGAM